MFWFSDAQWSRIQPLLPTNTRGMPHVDDRRVLCGIVHVLKSGCRWSDCPKEYGPHKTVYNRFIRWATFEARKVRIAGLFLLAIVVAKVFAFDMSTLEGIARALSLMGLGATLIGLGYLYQKLSYRDIAVSEREDVK